MVSISQLQHQAMRLAEGKGLGNYLISTGIDPDGFSIIAFPRVSGVGFSWVLFRDPIN